MTPVYEDVPGLGVELDGNVLRLLLNQPEKRNAVSDEMMRALVAAIGAAEEDERVRVIVLEGAGDDFCSGADIVARNAGDERPRAGSIQRRVPHTAHRLIGLLCTVQVPVVCVVRGWAAGLGLQLALAADVTVASEDAAFWEPFTFRGFTPDSAATWLLTRRVGPVRARDLLLLGRRLTGLQAVEWGLIHAAYKPKNVETQANEIIKQFAEGPTVALGLTKWLLHEAQDSSLEDQLRREAFGLELSSRSEDFREGLKAFSEKRDPEFGGR